MQDINIDIPHGYTKMAYGTFEMQYLFFWDERELISIWNIIFGEGKVILDIFKQRVISPGQALH